MRCATEELRQAVGLLADEQTSRHERVLLGAADRDRLALPERDQAL